MGICVYLGNADDFDSMGLVGELLPIECVHEEIAGGMSELTLTHPLDAYGFWKSLICGNIVKAAVPVRATPEIDMSNPSAPKRVTSVELWSVALGASKTDRYIMTKASGGKKKKLLPPGTEVVVVERGVSRHKVKCKFGTGYVAVAALTYLVTQTIPDTNAGIDKVAPPWSVTDQLFRIYKVNRDLTTVTVYARHIFYDLMGNLSIYQATSCSAGQALLGTLSACLTAHDFTAQTDMGDIRYAISWENFNPVKSLLDPEVGFVSRWGCQMVRDDYEITMLRRAGTDRGVRVEYRKNLLGVDCEEKQDAIITRIYPVGQNDKGKPVYLEGTGYPTKFVDSPKINDYPVINMELLDLSSTCKVSKSMTLAQCRAEMKRLSLLRFSEDHADQPSLSLKVSFVNLGDTSEYAAYKGLEELFLYDTVTIRHTELSIDAKADVVRVKFDVLLSRVLEIEMGTPRGLLSVPKITSWQIPIGIDGGKLLPNSVGSAELEDGAVTEDIIADGAVSTLKIEAYAITTELLHARAVTTETLDAKSVTTEKLDAGSVTTEILDAKSVTTEKLVAGSVTTDILDALSVTTEKLSAQSVTADKIAVNALIAQHIVAQVAEIVQAIINQASIGQVTINYADIVDLRALVGSIALFEAERASIDFAHIVDLVAGTAIITQGTAGELYIAKLRVTDAQIAQAVIGRIMTHDEDGNLVELAVNPDGSVRWSQTTLDAGKVLLAGSITADELNVAQIFGDAALIRAITAANIDTDTLTATMLKSGTIDASLIRISGTNQFYWDAANIVIQNPSNTNQQIRIGRYDGTNYGIAFTVNGGNTWQSAIGFNGIRLSTSNMTDIVDEVVDHLPDTYRVEIRSSWGQMLSEHVPETILSAVVFRGAIDVTSQIAANRFSWHRTSKDAMADSIWDENHTGVKSIEVTTSDVIIQAIFTCVVAEA